jgi:hypothetical protein
MKTALTAGTIFLLSLAISTISWVAAFGNWNIVQWEVWFRLMYIASTVYTFIIISNVYLKEQK